ncbi:hypothetical protein BMETH_26752373521495, partial [methanotrophic bacterial endosymbiont of Bathymodiolus sp.]
YIEPNIKISKENKNARATLYKTMETLETVETTTNYGG